MDDDAAVLGQYDAHCTLFAAVFAGDYEHQVVALDLVHA
jgi:hypothetical protein